MIDLADRRRLPFDGQTALDTLRGKVEASRFVPGAPASICVAEAPLLRKPEGGMDKILLRGEPVRVIAETETQAFVQSEWDSYVGYVSRDALGPAVDATHWVTARASHVYAAPDFKSPVIWTLSIGSALEETGEHSGFLEVADGFVPLQHVAAMDASQDRSEVALRLLGTPYLWGGNSASGIDCSGLVQIACRLAGFPCPRDSDQQAAELGEPLPADADLQGGDLVFWRGHVGMMLDSSDLIHANAYHMAVAIEPLAEACARISAQEFGDVTARRRLT